MQREAKGKTQELLKAKRRHKIWLRMAGVLMGAVVFCTTYALILPAITMTHTAYCGIEEHSHTDECYSVQAVMKKILTCSPEDDADFVFHTHGEMCYDDAGDLICSLAEHEAHTHGDDCYDDEGALICTLPEAEEHTHTDDCYNTDEVSGDKILSCGKPQIISHQHTESCISVTENAEETVSVLSCDIEEHAHEEQCYEQPESLSFSYSDEAASGVITLPWSKELPSDLSCTVVPISEGDEAYEEMLSSIDQTLSDGDMTRLDILLYNIEWYSGGASYTLPEGTTPTVNLTLHEEFDTSDGSSLTGLILNEIAAEPTQAEEPEIEDADEEAETAASSRKSARRAASLSAEAEDEDASGYDVSLITMSSSTLSVKLANSGTFGLAAVNKVKTVTGGYYRRVQSLEELNSLTFSSYNEKSVGSYNKFVFVFVNGMYALEGVCEDYSGTENGRSGYTYAGNFYPQFKLHKVEVQEIAGNPNYVTITENSTGTEYSPSNTPYQNYIIQSPHPGATYAGNKNVYLLREMTAAEGAWFYLRGGRSSSVWSDGIRFAYDSERNVFHIYTEENGYLSTNIEPEDSAYARYEGGQLGTLDSVALATKSETVTLTVKDYLNIAGGGYQVNNSEVVIYVYEETTLTIPTVDTENESKTLVPYATQPTYTAAEEPSDSVKGEDKDSGYSYASDTATSDIESLLSVTQYSSALTQEEKYNLQKQNDGRIVTDKSVIYGDNDYFDFGAYSADEFSVTLSALGQEWTISDETDIEAPIDVMFLLDFSGSMTDVADAATGQMRWQATIEATNAAINELLTRNPDNRVGVICFSNVAETLLPIGQYALPSDSEDYITYSGNDHTTVKTNPALTKLNETTGNYETYSSVSAFISGMWSATYTQLGLEQVYNEYSKVSTTTSKTLSNGDVISLSHKPVIIFLTDGEPTLGSYNYMKPSSGPRYGIGTVGENGMFGYYTILSANYFKNMVGIHYNTAASFYSIGIGIKSSGNGSYSVESNVNNVTSYYADDGYRRAVINPTKENVNFLTTVPTYSYNNSLTNYNMFISYYTASELLYNLLTGTPTDYIQNTEERYISNGYGTYYEQWLRGIKNPFSNYSYADASVFYGGFTQSQLSDYYTSIITTEQLINNYGFLLKDNTALTITDPIGEGMEVKGTPVLNYAGINYNNPSVATYDGYVEYTWNEVVTRQESDSKGKNIKLDLSVIKARVYTDADTGLQTVKFIIPEDVMPTLYPDLHKTFYYEELPARLIYQVGLTDESKATARKGDVFYTNTFTMSNGNAEADTTVTFMPETNNPYYYGGTLSAVDFMKTDNATDTAAYSFQEYRASGVVTQLLGNNGILEPSNVTQLTITKEWDGVEEDDRTDISIWLFRQKIYDDGTEGSVDYYGGWNGEYNLTADNNWTVTLPGLETEEDDEHGTYKWQYYVSESIFQSGSYGGSYGVTYTDGKGNILSYVSLPASLPKVEYDALRLYPITDSIIITNRPGDLTIRKTWLGDEIGAASIKVNIYQVRTPIAGNFGTVTKLVDTVTLEKDSWTYVYKNASSSGFDTDLMTYCYYDYYVEEVPVTDYIATYYSGDIELPASRLEVSGKNVYAYPASKNVTITNSKTVPRVTVTKEWEDGESLHTSDSIQVGLYARVRLDTSLDNIGSDAVTPVSYSYLLKDTQRLSAANSWSYTWSLTDIGTTYHSLDSVDADIYYTVEGYYIAEISKTSGYEPVFYSVDDEGNLVRTSLTDTITQYSKIFGTPQTVAQNGLVFSKDVTSSSSSTFITMATNSPIDLYPVSERVVMENVPKNKVTVTKQWADGVPRKSSVEVQLVPVQTSKQKQEPIESLSQFEERFGIKLTATLSAENNWTYTWSNLPLTYTENGVTIEFTYYVRELEVAYLPTYTDGDGVPLESITELSAVVDKESVPAAERPSDGTVIITNHLKTSDLVLTKKWQDVTKNKQEAVMVDIYRNTYSEDGLTLEKSGELYKTVELSEATYWTMTLTLPLAEFDSDGAIHTYQYFVKEQEGSLPYIVSYTDTDGETLQLEEMTPGSGEALPSVWLKASKESYSASAEVIITNTLGFELPQTGGTKHTLYTLSGLAIMLVTGSVYIITRRRKHIRGNGG